MNLYMKYNSPAENSDNGWEEYSLPLGNGYMGANVFGLCNCERIQITENSMVNPGMGSESGDPDLGGLTNFCELYVRFGHTDVSEYERGLCLNNGIAYVKYKSDGVSYKREYFTSYPDKVAVLKFSASEKGALNFELCPEIPFVRDYSREPGDNGGRNGSITANGDVITMRGRLHYYNIIFEAQMKVITDGRSASKKSSITVSNATEAVIIFTLGTNYKLCSEVFTTDDRHRKTLGDDPHEKVSAYLKEATSFNYDELKKRHTNDFTSYFNRVLLDLGEGDCGKMTDELLEEYKSGKKSRYLETLYFQYGRYLLISSSRKGCLPANLQGIWNCHEHSPWGSGYWHNINVQMNYWPAFNTNLVEMFESYADFFEAYYAKAAELAEEYIKRTNPENYEKGKCGFTIGTGAYPYYISSPGVHSGPGTGAMTSKLFWEYYDFTRDEKLLEGVCYKALKGMSEFLTKTVKYYDGEYLTSFSASPEQTHNGPFMHGPDRKYYHTVGCAFDQQFIYENGVDFLKASEILGIKNEVYDIQKAQIDKYSPVRIGWSGQIKEYLEEKFYGEIGEYNHRHISQLVGLCPGTSINSNTPAWLDAAKLTLTERGDKSTGWALAHRLGAWARTGDGNHCHKLISNLISERTNPNLFDEHPPFQIDGNFGATSAIGDMLMQSHEGYISILPSLPDCWESGSIRGLTARGAFEVDIDWKDKNAKRIAVKSKKGGLLRIKANITDASSIVCCGKKVRFELKNGITELETQAGCVYEITGIKEHQKEAPPSELTVSNELVLEWKGGACDIMRSVNGAPEYECIAHNVTSPFKDDFDFYKAEIITYKVAKQGSGCVTTINHSTELQRDIAKNIINSKR